MGLVTFLGMSTLFTSCKSDEEENTDVAPTINFIGGTGYTSADATVTVGSVLKIGVNAASNASSAKKLTKFTVVLTANNTPTTLVDSVINVSTYTYEANFTAPSVVGTARIAFKVVDIDGQSAEVSFNINTTAAPQAIDNHTVTLGAQNNTSNGSYLNLANGIASTQAVAEAASNLVDAIYYYGTSNFATICAPNDPTVGGGTGNLTLATGLTTKNATLFGTTSISAAAFDAMTDDSVISGLTGITATKVTSLTVGNVIAFKTVSNKLGLIKVVAIPAATNAGTIEIAIKIQQ